MTVFFSARASYSYESFERPQELLVYSQTGQETPYAAECIEHFARSAGPGRGNLRVLADEHDNFAWQWRWYLRDYPWVTYRTLNTDPVTEPPDDHLVMMSIWSEDANDEHLAGYTRLGELHTLWWFPNYAYGGVTPGDVLSGALTSEGWRTAVDYQLQREVASAMQFSRGAIYVRSDLVGHTEGARMQVVPGRAGLPGGGHCVTPLCPAGPPSPPHRVRGRLGPRRNNGALSDRVRE